MRSRGAWCAVALLLVGGRASAQDKAVERDVVALIPPGFECLADLDARALAAWPRLPEILDAMPEGRADLEAGGFWPPGDLDGLTWAASRTAQGLRGIVVVRGEATARMRAWFHSTPPDPRRANETLRGPQLDLVTLAPRLAVVATPAVVAYARRQLDGAAPRFSDAERELRAAFAALPARGGFRVACQASARTQAELAGAFALPAVCPGLTVAVRLGDGIALEAAAQCPNANAATLVRAFTERRLAIYRRSIFARIAKLEPFFKPIVITQKDARVELRYALDAALIRRALAALRVLRDLRDSSGDPVR